MNAIDAALIMSGLILLLLQFLTGNRLSEVEQLHKWLTIEHNKLKADYDDMEAQLTMFLAGHVNVTEKPERTPGMP